MMCKTCGENPKKAGRSVCHPCHLAERRVREAESNKRKNIADRERYATDAKFRLVIQARNTLHFYNLTPCQFTRMLVEQDGKCAICYTRDPGAKKWSVDHDHECCDGPRSCGKCVRSLLCTKRNTGIAMFGDDIVRLKGAIAYLEEHRYG